MNATYHSDRAVATITMNQPARLNALDAEMIMEIGGLIETARRDRGVRALVLRGAGRAFCAGDTLAKEDRFRYGSPDLETRMKTGYQGLVVELMKLRKPVIAAVHGYAVGAGLDLALAADFRVVATGTTFGAVFIRRGLGGGGSYLLPRYVGLGRATELLLLGEMFSAAQAQEWGMVTSLVDAADLDGAVDDLARRLANGPTEAIGAIKQARNWGLAAEPPKGMEYQTLANIELMFHRDAREGPQAFSEKREPQFTADWIDLQYD